MLPIYKWIYRGFPAQNYSEDAEVYKEWSKQWDKAFPVEKFACGIHRLLLKRMN